MKRRVNKRNPPHLCKWKAYFQRSGHVLVHPEKNNFTKQFSLMIEVQSQFASSKCRKPTDFKEFIKMTILKARESDSQECTRR